MGSRSPNEMEEDGGNTPGRTDLQQLFQKCEGTRDFGVECEGERGKYVGDIGWEKGAGKKRKEEGERNRGGTGRSTDRKLVQPVSGQTVQ